MRRSRGDNYNRDRGLTFVLLIALRITVLAFRAESVFLDLYGLSIARQRRALTGPPQLRCRSEATYSSHGRDIMKLKTTLAIAVAAASSVLAASFQVPSMQRKRCFIVGSLR
jgi:hypothetical protein